jgi:uncharacterized damage-inducible protein DinB
MTDSKQEYWLRGPVPGITELLQPVAHAILQAYEEAVTTLQDFPDHKLWDRPAGVASVAFHLQHLAGVLDRLFTYAKNEQLTEAQLERMRTEGKWSAGLSVKQLLDAFRLQVEVSIDLLKTIPADRMLEHRSVGRKQIPSTVAGLLFHAAEHTMRHTGQLLVTAKIVRSIATSDAG